MVVAVVVVVVVGCPWEESSDVVVVVVGCGGGDGIFVVAVNCVVVGCKVVVGFVVGDDCCTMCCESTMSLPCCDILEDWKLYCLFLVGCKKNKYINT